MLHQESSQLTPGLLMADMLTAVLAAQERLVSLFEGQGMTCQAVHMVQRCITNRASGAEMHRRWLQATFVKGPLPDGAEVCKGSRALFGQPSRGSWA